MSKRWGVDFKGVDGYLYALKQVQGAAEKAVEQALVETQKIVAEKAEAAIQPHTADTPGKHTADTILWDGNVLWTGEIAEIAVGFRIADESGELPGLPSIFLMYGTTEKGQPKMQADQAMYEAVYGKRVRQEARKVQKAIFDEAIKKAMGE